MSICQDLVDLNVYTITADNAGNPIPLTIWNRNIRICMLIQGVIFYYSHFNYSIFNTIVSM